MFATTLEMFRPTESHHVSYDPAVLNRQGPSSGPYTAASPAPALRSCLSIDVIGTVSLSRSAADHAWKAWLTWDAFVGTGLAPRSSRQAHHE
jgi:hypothetical protein